jgi:hypothetical protein
MILNGATTFSIMTLSITTFSRVQISITIFSRTTFSANTLVIVTLSIMYLNATLSKKTPSIFTFSITTSVLEYSA